MKLVIDRLWLYEYLNQKKTQMRSIEQICDSLKIARNNADSVEEITLQKIINDMEHVKEELAVIYESLEEYIEGVDEAKMILDKVVQEVQEILLY